MNPMRSLFRSMAAGAIVSLNAVWAYAQTATPTVTPYPVACSEETSWGGSGSGPGQFNQMRQMAVYGDVMYVVDKGNGRIQRFTLSGTPILPALTAGGSLSQPFGVGVGPTGRVFVSENGAGSGQRLLEIDPATDAVVSVLQSGYASYGGVAVDSEGDVYVSTVLDPNPMLAAKFHESPPGSWNQVASIQYPPSVNGYLVNLALPISNGATVYVLDTGNSRVAEFHEMPADSNAYVFTRYVASALPPDSPPGYTVWPKQLAVDAQGYFYLTDISQRFQVFAPDWSFRYVCPVLDEDAYGVAVDGSGYIYKGLNDVGIIRKYRPSLMPPPYMSPTPVPPSCGSSLKSPYVYPSPLSPGMGRVYVQLCRSEEVKIHFYNAAGGLAGKLVFSGVAGDNHKVYDFSGYAPGVYYFLVQYGSQHLPTQKFAIIR